MGQEKKDQDVFDKMYVGAFDPDAWNGIVFDGTAYGQRVPFAIRVGSKSGRFLDGERIFDAVSTVGPHAPDGSYALLSWRHYPRTAPVTLEWSRIDRTTVVGRLRAPADMHLVLEAYSPFELDFTGAYYISRDGKQIIGDHHIDGHFTSVAHFVVATDRPIVGTATFPNSAVPARLSGAASGGPRSAPRHARDRPGPLERAPLASERPHLRVQEGALQLEQFRDIACIHEAMGEIERTLHIQPGEADGEA